MTYPIVSLFSGAGFLDLGFLEHNFDIVWGCEVVPEFARAHDFNLANRHGQIGVIENTDITQTVVSELPRVVGVIGGPPCQDFSVGNASGPGIQGDRGRLVWDYLSKIASINPDFFLFENVATLYRTKRHRIEALYPLVGKFKELGYTVYYSLQNALDYGVPQDRSRLFIVGFKQNIIKTLGLFGHKGFSWPQPRYGEVDVKRSFDWVGPWPFNSQVDETIFIGAMSYPYELTVHSMIGNEGELRSLPNHVSFQPYSQKFTQIDEGDDSRKSFKRLHRFRYSPTVAYGNNEVHLHPTLPRRLTVREALRIQSVPDWYEFPGDIPLSKMFKMVGNGVPYKMAVELAASVQDVLDAYAKVEGSVMQSLVTAP